MDFLYGAAFRTELPEAYERLILDCLLGDATLFTRADEVDAQWELVDSIVGRLEAREAALPQLRRRHLGPARGRRADPARGTRVATTLKDVSVDEVERRLDALESHDEIRSADERPHAHGLGAARVVPGGRRA